jgi:redox-sensitive bicupin YhaK (pirin superfamily)
VARQLLKQGWKVFARLKSERKTEPVMKETQLDSWNKAATGRREPRKHGCMITVRRSGTRRRVRSGTQDTWLTFDPETHADRFRSGFRTLEALNEETPVSEMNLHPHPQDVEIVTYVREGTLVHQDLKGELGRVESGEFQRTSARRRVRHRVINGSLLNPAHVFQSCITPDGIEGEPVTEQKRFPVVDREGVLRLVASPDGRDGSLCIQQDVRMYSSVLLVGHHLVHELSAGRAAWLHVVKGRVLLKGRVLPEDEHLGTGDAAAVENQRAVSFTAEVPSEILLFDLA